MAEERGGCEGRRRSPALERPDSHFFGTDEFVECGHVCLARDVDRVLALGCPSEVQTIAGRAEDRADVRGVVANPNIAARPVARPTF